MLKTKITRNIKVTQGSQTSVWKTILFFLLEGHCTDWSWHVYIEWWESLRLTQIATNWSAAIWFTWRDMSRWAGRTEANPQATGKVHAPDIQKSIFGIIVGCQTNIKYLQSIHAVSSSATWTNVKSSNLTVLTQSGKSGFATSLKCILAQ